MRQWKTFRVVAINAHVGLAIRGGLISWIRVFLPFTSVILACEVTNPRLLRERLGKRWMVVPVGHVTRNYVCTRRRRWRGRQITAVDIGFGSKHIRHLVGMFAVHDAGVKARFSVLHPDPLGQGFARAKGGARARHVRQVRAVVKYHSDPLTERVFQCSGGDQNEQTIMPPLSRPVAALTAQSQFAQQGMVSARKIAKEAKGPQRLMAIYVTNAPWVRVRKFRTYTPRVRGLDHEVAVAWVRVKRGR